MGSGRPSRRRKDLGSTSGNPERDPMLIPSGRRQLSTRKKLSKILRSPRTKVLFTCSALTDRRSSTLTSPSLTRTVVVEVEAVENWFLRGEALCVLEAHLIHPPQHFHLIIGLFTLRICIDHVLEGLGPV